MEKSSEMFWLEGFQALCKTFNPKVTGSNHILVKKYLCAFHTFD